jgi:predicted amidohydrolase YtcJ
VGAGSTPTPDSAPLDAPGEQVDDPVDNGTPPIGTPEVGRIVLQGAAGGDLAFDPQTGRIVDGAGDARVIDVAGRWLAPAFIDSHVHLAYYAVREDLMKAGVVAAVDLAAPERFVAPVATGADPLGARVVWAGPMITPLRGYPTQSWGREGYGAECADLATCGDIVDRLVDAGAGLIKVPVGQGPDHDADVLAGITARAHARQVPVTAHALGDDGAARAAAGGVDILAHTPTQRLTDATVQAWRGRAVISTLSAFGGREDTIENLRRLRAVGATVLYGTDLGNTRTVGVDASEVALLLDAGLDGAAIVHAGTLAPAEFWGLTDLGSLTPGKSASLLVLDADPAVDPSVLARPEQVWIDGARQR